MSNPYKKYRPSNGNEGCWFDDKFCENCKHDAAYRRAIEKNLSFKEGCKTLMYAFCLDIDHKKYPKQWIHDKEDNPTCTRFKDKRIKTKRKKYYRKDKKTMELF